MFVVIGTANYQVTAGTGVSAFTPNTEPVVFYTAAAQVANSLTYQIELSAFKDTLMELNKKIYFDNNLLLTINWNSRKKLASQQLQQQQSQVKLPRHLYRLCLINIFTQHVRQILLLYHN